MSSDRMCCLSRQLKALEKSTWSKVWETMSIMPGTSMPTCKGRSFHTAVPCHLMTTTLATRRQRVSPTAMGWIPPIHLVEGKLGGTCEAVSKPGVEAA